MRMSLFYRAAAETPAVAWRLTLEGVFSSKSAVTPEQACAQFYYRPLA
jgi:hypothetical protein